MGRLPVALQGLDGECDIGLEFCEFGYRRRQLTVLPPELGYLVLQLFENEIELERERQHVIDAIEGERQRERERQ